MSAHLLAPLPTVQLSPPPDTEGEKKRESKRKREGEIKRGRRGEKGGERVCVQENRRISE